MTTDTDTDDLGKRRIVSEGAKSIADMAHVTGQIYLRMRAMGLTAEAIIERVLDHLDPRHAQPLRASDYATNFGVVLAATEAILGNGTPQEKMGAIRDAIGVDPDSDFAPMFHKLDSAIDRIGSHPEVRMRTTIQRLFKEAESPLPYQSPAMECHVVLTGGVMLEGVLSETPEGELRLLCPSAGAPGSDPYMRPKPNERLMIEHFFAYSDVVTVSVKRTIVVENTPTIIVQ